MVGYKADGSPRIYTINRKTEAEARAAHLKLMMRHAKGELVQQGQVALLVWLTDFAEELAGGVSPSTREKHQSYLKILATDPLAQMNLGDIKVVHLERFYLALSRRYSKGTVMHIKNFITRGMRKAARYEMISSNPADHAEMPRMTSTPISRALSREDVERFLNVNADHRLIRLWATILALGLRHSEALDLKWEMLGQDAEGYPTLLIPGTKTASARRTAYLPDELLSLLDEQREQNELEALYAEEYRDQGYIFPSLVGTRLSHHNVLRSYRIALEKAGIDPTYRIHDLRATYITHQIADGVDPRTVAAAVGHTDPRTTLAIYAHVVTAKARLAAREGGSRMLARVKPPAEPAPTSAYGAALTAALEVAPLSGWVTNAMIRASHPDHTSENIGAALKSPYFELDDTPPGEKQRYKLSRKGVVKKAMQGRN